MPNLPPSQNYPRFEPTQFPRPPYIDWNLASVADLPGWISAYPNIPTLLSQAEQQKPTYADMNLQVKAERVGFSASDVDLHLESSIAKEFQSRCQKWKHDTKAISSVSEIVMHPEYQWIMAKGERALPLILRDLQQNGGAWFHALYYIHGRDEAAGAKTVGDATAAWIEWGYKNNHI